MKINKKLKRLAKRYKVLPDRVQCLCVRHCTKFPQPSADFPRIVCPRCGGRGYIQKRKEILTDAYMLYNLNRGAFVVLGAAILILALAAML